MPFRICLDYFDGVLWHHASNFDGILVVFPEELLFAQHTQIIDRFVCLQVVHPKSDSQRKSLLEAVKEILLFRSLDQEQLAEVLDAMFERKVSPEEYIIRQVMSLLVAFPHS